MVGKLIELAGELDLLKIENHELKKEKLTMIAMAENCKGFCSACVGRFICPFIKFVNPIIQRNRAQCIIFTLCLFDSDIAYYIGIWGINPYI